MIAVSTGIKKRDALRLEMEKCLNAAIAEKTKKYQAFFENIQKEVKQSADYLKKLYENSNPPEDNGIPILLLWDGKQYGNDEIRNKLKNEILIKRVRLNRSSNEKLCIMVFTFFSERRSIPFYRFPARDLRLRIAPQSKHCPYEQEANPSNSSG